MSVRSFAAIALGFVVLLASSATSAYPVELVSDNRRVDAALIEPNVFGQGYDTYLVVHEVPDPAFSDFSTGPGASRATQTSTVSTLGFQSEGSGFAMSNSPGNTEYGTSTFLITFDVTKATEAWVSGSISVAGGESSFDLWRVGTPNETLYTNSLTGGFIGSGGSGLLIDELIWHGILLPGQYRVSARANGDDGTGFHDFQVTFSPEIAPEPSTALLLGLGLGMLARSRRSQR